MESREGTTDTLPVTSTQTEPVPSFVRISTPTPGATSTVPEMNLTQLESCLRIATSSRTVLPELLPAVDPANETSAVSLLQPETDDSSSFCDAPDLPQGEAKVRFLDEGAETEETWNETSHLSCPELYSLIPVPQNPSSSTEDTLTHAPEVLSAQAGPSTSGLPGSQLRELSGRSRAILKQYFVKTQQPSLFL